MARNLFTDVVGGVAGRVKSGDVAISGLGFRVKGTGSRVWDVLEFGVCWLRVKGFRVQDSGFAGPWFGVCVGLRVWGLCRAQGLGFV